MNIKQWWLTAAALFMVFIAGLFIPSEPIDLWYATSSTLSVIAVFAILSISNSWTSILLASFEVMALAVVGFSWLIPDSFFDLNHKLLIYTVLAAEILTLLNWKRRDGINAAISKREWMADFLRATASNMRKDSGSMLTEEDSK